jgi:hypothetical protein
MGEKMKHLLCAFVFLFCIGTSSASLTEIKFYLFEKILEAENKIPEAQKAVEKAQAALAKYKDKKPTIYYVVGGVKKEAVDDEFVKLTNAVDIAVREVASLTNYIRTTKTEIRELCDVPDKNWDKFWEQLKKQHEQRQEALKKKIADQITGWKNAGKTEEEIQKFLDDWVQREAKAQVQKETFLLKEIKQFKEKKERSRQMPVRGDQDIRVRAR